MGYQDEVVRERPGGTLLLGPLLLLGGIGIVAISLLPIQKPEELVALGIAPAFVRISAIFIGLVAIGAGLGLCIGKRWGWWLTAFYFAYGVARGINGLFAGFMIDAELAGAGELLGKHFFKMVVRITANSMFLVYLYRENIRRYFMV